MTADDQPLSHAVRSEVLNVVRQAFHYRGDVKLLMLGAGVPVEFYGRYYSPENARVKLRGQSSMSCRRLEHRPGGSSVRLLPNCAPCVGRATTLRACGQQGRRWISCGGR